MPRCICFDFDGTLVNSIEAAFNAFQKVGPEYGCAPLTREGMQALRELHAREILRSLGVPFYRLPQVAAHMRRVMRAELMETPPVEGMGEVLRGLSRQGFRLGVLSSNAASSVRDYVRSKELGEFDFVVGGTGLFGKSGAITAQLARDTLQPHELLYVGDELRDLDAARRAGVPFAAVGWGYTSPARLADAKPDYLLEKPSDLFDCIRPVNALAARI